MKTYSRLLLAFLLLILVVPQVGADEPLESGEEVIVWSDSSGKFKIEASFVELVDDKLVVLKRASDGKIIKVPLDKLDEESKSQAKSLHAEAQKSSLDPAVEKQLEEMGLVRQKNTWRLEEEVKLDKKILSLKKLVKKYETTSTNQKIFLKKMAGQPSKKSTNKSKSKKSKAKNNNSITKQLRRQIFDAAVKKTQKDLNMKRKPSPSAIKYVANYDPSLFNGKKIVLSNSGKSPSLYKSGADLADQRDFDNYAVRLFKKKYDELKKAKSPNTTKMPSKNTGKLSDAYDILEAQIKTLIPLIGQGLDEIVVTHQELIDNRAAFNNKAEEIRELLEVSGQILKIASDDQLQKKMDRLAKDLPSGFSMRSIDEINKETEESKKDEG